MNQTVQRQSPIATSRARDTGKGSACLVLESGAQFWGTAIGAPGTTVGELVCNTSPTGYQEILTDPSYTRQVVTLTYPHVGNTGCNEEDDESGQCHAAGLVIRERPRAPSNWRSRGPLSQWLTERGVVALADVDTRQLTHLLRQQGALRCAIGTTDSDADELDPMALLSSAQGFPGLLGADLASSVTTPVSYDWSRGIAEVERLSPAPKPHGRHV